MFAYLVILFILISFIEQKFPHKITSYLIVIKDRHEYYRANTIQLINITFILIDIFQINLKYS